MEKEEFMGGSGETLSMHTHRPEKLCQMPGEPGQAARLGNWLGWYVWNSNQQHLMGGTGGALCTYMKSM